MLNIIHIGIYIKSWLGSVIFISVLSPTIYIFCILVLFSWLFDLWKPSFVITLVGGVGKFVLAT